MRSCAHQNVTALRSPNRPHIAWLTASLSCVSVVTVASAQTDESKDPEEVIVTAQRRAERLQDVPISISVLSGDDLDSSVAGGITEILRSVPGVATNVSVQGGGTQLTVRGVSAAGPLFYGSSPIAYYLDSAPFGLVKSSIGPDINAYDLERLEILRGPQGTLYGASAQNGVVRVLTKDADLQGFELKARTSGSSTDNGGNSYRGDMALNVPIIDGKLAARAVAGYQDVGGWIDRPNKKDANSAEIRTLRLKVNAQPNDALSIGLSAWSQRSDFDAPSFSQDNRTIATTLPEPFSTDYDVYGMKIGYDFTGVSITSSTSLLKYTNDGQGANGIPGNVTQTRNESEVFSQEVSVQSTAATLWRWSAGAMYRDGEDRLFQDFIPRLPAFLPVPFDWADKSQSFAVFGEVTRSFLDGQLELTGGLRYFEDDVEQSEHISGTVPAQQRYRATKNYEKVSPRAVVTWHPSKDMTLYGSYSEGFRSGFSQNAQVNRSAPGFPAVRPDNLKNYEVGSKGDVWGNRFNYEVAVYYIDWEDVQQPLQVPFGSIFISAPINGKSASGMGAEMAVSTHPVDGLTLSASFSWNDLQQDEEVRAFAAGAPQGVVVFRKGERLNLSPEKTAGASVDYSFDLGSGYQADFSVSGNYVSVQYSRRLIGTTVQSSIGDDMLIGHGSVSIISPQRWTATLFVDNFNNENGAYINNWLGVAAQDMHARPRTYGLQLEYRL